MGVSRASCKWKVNLVQSQGLADDSDPVWLVVFLNLTSEELGSSAGLARACECEVKNEIERHHRVWLQIGLFKDTANCNCLFSYDQSMPKGTRV